MRRIAGFIILAQLESGTLCQRWVHIRRFFWPFKRELRYFLRSYITQLFRVRAQSVGEALSCFTFYFTSFRVIFPIQCIPSLAKWGGRRGKKIQHPKRAEGKPVRTNKRCSQGERNILSESKWHANADVQSKICKPLTQTSLARVIYMDFWKDKKNSFSEQDIQEKIIILPVYP